MQDEKVKFKPTNSYEHDRMWIAKAINIFHR